PPVVVQRRSRERNGWPAVSANSGAASVPGCPSRAIVERGELRFKRRPPCVSNGRGVVSENRFSRNAASSQEGVQDAPGPDLAALFDTSNRSCVPESLLTEERSSSWLKSLACRQERSSSSTVASWTAPVGRVSIRS